jgi:drug/metabolite transporter (DMT)-like permease
MGSGPPGATRTKLLLAFAAIYVLWGSTYLAIRLAVDTLPPFLMAGSRFLVAGAVLFAFAPRTGRPPSARHWRNAALAGIPLFVLGNGGVTWAEQVVPSGAAALVIATLPAWLLLLDWGYGGRGGPRGVELVGVGLGVAGVATLTAPGGVNPAGAGVLLLAAVAWAVGSLVNRYADLPPSPVRAAGMQMLVGGAVLLGLGLVAGEGARLDPAAVSGRSVAAWAYLAAVAVVALPAYTWLLTAASPALVGTYAFVNPVVAVLLGWAFADEELGGRTGPATGLVVLGVMLLIGSRRSSQPGRAPATAPAGTRAKELPVADPAGKADHAIYCGGQSPGA